MTKHPNKSQMQINVNPFKNAITRVFFFSFYTQVNKERPNQEIERTNKKKKNWFLNLLWFRKTGDSEELRKHLLGCIVARRESKDITLKRHFSIILHFPDIDDSLSSITQHCWIQNQSQKAQNNNSKSCRRRRKRAGAHLWSYLQRHTPLEPWHFIWVPMRNGKSVFDYLSVKYGEYNIQAIYEYTG